MPFRPSTTLENICNVGPTPRSTTSTDTRLFAGCVTGRRDWPMLPAERIAWRAPGLRAGPRGAAKSSASRRTTSSAPVLRAGARARSRQPCAVHRPQPRQGRGGRRRHPGEPPAACCRRKRSSANWPTCRSPSTRPPAPEEREAWGWLHGSRCVPIEKRARDERPRPRWSACAMPGGAARRRPRRRLHRPEGAAPGALGGLARDDTSAPSSPRCASAASAPPHQRHDRRPSDGRFVAQILDSASRTLGSCGVDYVKVGIERDPGAGAVLSSTPWPTAAARWYRCSSPTAGSTSDARHAGVHIARWAGAASRRIMLDTAEKQRRQPVRRAGHRGAAALRLRHAVRGGRMRSSAWPARCAPVARRRAGGSWQPDFAGFRSAVCVRRAGIATRCGPDARSAWRGSACCRCASRCAPSHASLSRTSWRSSSSPMHQRVQARWPTTSIAQAAGLPPAIRRSG
jgi:hypothetical protein